MAQLQKGTTEMAVLTFKGVRRMSEGFYVLPLCIFDTFLFDTKTLISQPAERRPAKSIWSWPNSQKLLRYFVHSSSEFYISK